MTEVPPLRDVVVLNESSSFHRPGDVSLFRTRKDALSYIEPIDVENNEYVALSGDGRLLALTAVSGVVHITDVTDGIDHSHILKTWLQDTAAHIAAAQAARRKRGATPAQRAQESDASIEELMRFIGFS